jgi:hypothetical protein
MSVRRYSSSMVDPDRPIFSDEIGKYVEYADYAALEAECKRLREELANAHIQIAEQSTGKG